MGGGLSGLHTAHELHKRGIEFRLLEARHRMGGRILSKSPQINPVDSTVAAFDLGPSWFWPHQKRIQALLKELKLNQAIFEQPELGANLYEDHNGSIVQGITGTSMRGSYRIKGGLQGIIANLIEKLADTAYLTASTVKQITYQNEILKTQIISNDELWNINSDFVVLALPPRLAAKSLQFNPQLSPSRLTQLKNIGTWMAAHAKVAILYNEPFWTNQGLSGNVISQLGPLQEIHDANTPQSKPYGLIGFVGIDANDRLNKNDQLRAEIVTQLVRLFGDAAASPIEMYLKDWAFDIHTATEEDREFMLFHPSSTFDEKTEVNWDGRLIWSGTETAGTGERNNGYLEGALEASERTINTLMARL